MASPCTSENREGGTLFQEPDTVWAHRISVLVLKWLDSPSALDDPLPLRGDVGFVVSG